ncbi:citramalate synthase [Sediminispirochaeta smaragdinae]|uniref:Citramalate synthase n=1 Tax=Sediminispirochaeta smaragdinae (strain DSM 11293 / JCM 15392 / SEBR 4228) TaxID=573413 RepID=E1R5X0_SEDSS|nr:citramalate synthase [Sediminispirochaeta smaragdinae]ADK80735.1 2-isopropylmalate synthase/homocitrate synthase family protein [Sediminispirochaeta smaragdinae DSM 11293]
MSNASREKIMIFDTTLRDGAQTRGVAFSVEDKIRIARGLDQLGVDFIEGGWPGSNPKDVAFFHEMKKAPLSRASLTAFSSTRMKNMAVEEDANIRTLCETGVPAVAIFGKSWDLHVTEALETSLDENLAMVSSTISYLRGRFEKIIFDAEHYFDGFKADRGYALAVIEAAASAGADWIALCDTNGGSLPSEILEAQEAAAARVTVPLGIHAHNDSELAVANSLVAVGAGARMVQGTINGLGERCGNANLCSVIPNLELKGNFRCLPEGQLEKLTHISHLVSEAANRSQPDWLPYVGRNAFAHKGGIHVSAVRKNSRCYEHVSPELVGNDRIVTISELSGKSNVLEKVKKLGIDLSDDPKRTAGILKAVKELEARGYHFEGADASFELLSARELGTLKDYFTLQGFRVLTWAEGDGKSWSEATIKAAVPEEVSLSGGYSDPVEHTSADGSGPVEALDRALRKVLEKFYPVLGTVKLSDYKVRILNEEAGTNATTRVMISSTDGVDHWTTVGVSDNILDASWHALCDSLIYKLKKEDESRRHSGGGSIEEDKEVAYAAQN